MSDFQSLVDRTRFQVVRRLVSRPGSPITDVLFVESRTLLFEMAEVLTSPVSAARRQRLQRWFDEGRVTVGTASARPNPAPPDSHEIDLLSIEREALCDVLYLPPFFLVHLTGGFVSSLAVDAG